MRRNYSEERRKGKARHGMESGKSATRVSEEIGSPLISTKKITTS